MKLYKIIKGIIIILIIQSCATSKQAEFGKTEYKSGNYQSALVSLEQIINNAEKYGKNADTTTYYYAGASALKLKNNSKARKYLEKAKHLKMNSPDMFFALACVYKNIDNLSLELEALEYYHNNFGTGTKKQIIDTMLFEVFIEIEEWQKALSLWSEIKDNSQSDIKLLSKYLLINKKLKRNKEGDKIANKIQTLDHNNTDAMEWFAEKYFWKAENTYLSEMKAYKKHKTTKQYKKLLKAWDLIWPAFRKSRDYFLKLYKINPKPEYAMYLHNIYKRMKKNKKANYYYKIWKKG